MSYTCSMISVLFFNYFCHMIRKKYALYVALMLCISSALYARSGKYAIIGKWVNEHEDLKVEFYVGADSTFHAKLIWVKNERKKEREGMVFIKGMVYDEEQSRWLTEYMYSPDHKMVAKGILWIDEDGVLNVRGKKLGISAVEKFSRIE